MMTLLTAFAIFLLIMAWHEWGLEYLREKYPTNQSFADASVFDRFCIVLLAGPIVWVFSSFVIINLYLKKFKIL